MLHSLQHVLAVNSHPQGEQLSQITLQWSYGSPCSTHIYVSVVVFDPKGS